MRILIGADTYAPDVNGASYFAQRLAGALAGRGREVHVVCPALTRRTTSQTAAGVSVHRVASVGTPFHPTFRVSPPPLGRRALSNIVAQVDPDVIHVQAHFLLGRALARIADRRLIPLVATNHFMPENLVTYVPLPAAVHGVLAKLAWADFARVYNRAQVVTTPTPRAAELLGSTPLRRPVLPVSCGVDLVRFTPRNGGKRTAGWWNLPDRPTILFVGRLDEEKHLDIVVTALAAVHRQVEAQVLLVGAGARRIALQRQADALGLTDHVRFAGFVKDAELPSAYAACDVFVNAGTAELQSLVTMEAMASGKPVVAANAMALPHLVRDGVNGFLFRPQDASHLADRLLALLLDDELRDRMGRASRALIEPHSLDKVVMTYEQLYQSVQVRAVGSSSLTSQRPMVVAPAPGPAADPAEVLPAPRRTQPRAGIGRKSVGGKADDT